MLPDRSRMTSACARASPTAPRASACLNCPATARIILTAYAGPTAQIPRLRQSIECMIAKPWDDSMLRLALREFLSERELEESNDQRFD